MHRALEHEDVVSFGEVTHATLGRAGQRLVEVLLLVSQGGAAPHQTALCILGMHKVLGTNILLPIVPLDLLFSALLL